MESGDKAMTDIDSDAVTASITTDVSASLIPPTPETSTSFTLSPQHVNSPLNSSNVTPHTPSPSSSFPTSYPFYALFHPAFYSPFHPQLSSPLDLSPHNTTLVTLNPSSPLASSTSPPTSLHATSTSPTMSLHATSTSLPTLYSTPCSTLLATSYTPACSSTHAETSGYVHLNVGGQFFTTSKSTINLEYKSMLATAVRDHISKHGTHIPIFFDRCGRRFSHVLNYLRNGTVNMEKLTSLYELQEEADYFGLQALLKLLESVIETAIRRGTIEKERQEKILSTLIQISDQLDGDRSSKLRKVDESVRSPLFTMDDDF